MHQLKQTRKLRKDAEKTDEVKSDAPAKADKEVELRKLMR